MMQGQETSYLDLSVLPELRNRVLSPNAVVVFSEDLHEILWANANGAQLFGGHGVADLLAAKLSDNQSFVRQLRDAISQMEKDGPIIRGFRISQGLRSLLLQVEIKRFALPNTGNAYVISTSAGMDSPRQNETGLAQTAVESLEEFADAAAILDDYGLPLAMSENFSDLGPAEEMLLNLVAELKQQEDRLIKRPVANVSGNTVALGLARLTDTPGRNLIVLAETETAAEVATATSPAIEEAPAKPEIDDKEPAATESPTEPEIESVPEEVAEIEAPVLQTEIAGEPAVDEPEVKSGADADGSAQTVRFGWKVDAGGIFRSVSGELAETVGENAANIEGRSWSDVATVFGFDTNKEIRKLLEKQDTWSGKTVLWPIQGTDMVVPVDLAALPVFGSDREFEGFKGYGVIRTADTILDPEETGLALASPEAADETGNEDVGLRLEDDPAQEEDRPGNSSVSNIVRLQPRRKQNLEEREEALSEKEASAFRVIGEKLRNRDEAGNKTGKKGRKKQKKRKPPRLDTSLIENLPIAILVYRSNKTLFANHELLEISGYKSRKQLARAGGVDALLGKGFDENEAGGTDCYLTTRRGEKIRIRPVLHTVPWAGKKALLMSFVPDELLVQSEPNVLEISQVSEIQNILDTTSDGIILTEPDGEVISINASAEALFGQGFEEAAGKNLAELFATESRNTIRQYVENLSMPGVTSLLNDGEEVIASEASGGMIPVFLTISRMESSQKLCAVIRDMTSWKKAEEELIQARRTAEGASEQKTDFLAHVSHEIRTPLNAIIGFSDVMIEERFGPIDNERYREYLRDINRSGSHVLELVNDLLDLSKIEAGKLELAFEAVDLNQVAAESVALLQPQANRNRIIIRTSLSRAVPKVVADTRSIRQIILNLVSNAIKFSPANSQVIVSTVYESSGEVALRVRDTGRGMSKIELEDALKPFHQGKRASDKTSEGTGLGLPLTKALVEANRAHFDLESEPDNGTMAHVQFPTQRVLAD